MVHRLERLLNLVIALRETHRPLSVDAINQRVAGYEGDRDEAWRRMFERDKADLREMGVPIATERLDRFDDALGYRIHPADYDLPDLSFTPAELTALALAVQVTGLGDDAGPGLEKLAVDADVPGVPRQVPTLPVEIGLDAPNRAALTDAVLARRRVRFTYRRPADAPGDVRVRRVEPHALLHYRGRWYLRGLDLDREDDRTFRLDRIDGPVHLTGEAGAFTPPVEVPDPRVVVPGADVEPVDAVVRATEEVAWAVARRARGAGAVDDDGWRRFAIRVADPDAFVSWVLDLGPDLEVVSPPDLRRRVIEHLQAVLV